MNAAQPSSADASRMVRTPERMQVIERWQLDEDIAFGCECANPALQIERWGQDADAAPRELY